MENKGKTIINVSASVNASIDRIWKNWTTPNDIEQWYHASEDWHCPEADNDLRPGGKFLFRMEAKDGSFGFDFEGVYGEIKNNELISYTIGDGRKVTVTFAGESNSTRVVEIFEAEDVNPIEIQRGGWQAILDNFKKYAESQL